ncbi:hypothetical protein C4A76_17910 [Brevibacillus laterosporus]|uniref:DUF418 domain-containing protein n=2 Tax=Brevibacillus laterosporus TaxID=1465 RepID=A0AAP8QCF2_BRELA|nr:hypothetical protein C4A76_17910 [Brevibacillus laterosporus]PPA93679.1 hypothetical protein C4A77_16915 [Brevibacillus laterosporus]
MITQACMPAPHNLSGLYSVLWHIFRYKSKLYSLIIGIVGLMVACFFAIKALITLPLMLIGLAAGQYRFFEHISEKSKQIAMFTGIMLFISIAGILYQYSQVPASPFPPMVLGGTGDPTIEQANYFLQIGIMIGPVISSVYVGIMILLLQCKFAQILLLPLKTYGRMALTNYLGQTFLLLAIAHLCNLFEHITYIQSFLLCVVIYVIQILFSMIWMRFFTMGPIEWGWRVVTYWKVPIFEKIEACTMYHDT